MHLARSAQFLSVSFPVSTDAYSKPLVIQHEHPSRRLEETALARLIYHVVEAEDGSLVHLSVVLAGHDTVRALNEAYLGHDYNTDVLSFTLTDENTVGVVEGEIYIDLDTAAERHDEFNTSFEREARRYVVHGLLHLLGYDDQTEAGRNAMRTREDKYLAAVS